MTFPENITAFLDEWERHDRGKLRTTFGHVAILALLFCIPSAILILLVVGATGEDLKQGEKAVAIVLSSVFSLFLGLNLRAVINNAISANALKKRSSRISATYISYTRKRFATNRRSKSSRGLKRRHFKHILHFQANTDRGALCFDSDMVGIDETSSRQLDQIKGCLVDVLYDPENPRVYHVLLGTLRPPELN